MWITSLLFDLNFISLIGASLLALAKSILSGKAIDQQISVVCSHNFEIRLWTALTHPLLGNISVVSLFLTHLLVHIFTTLTLFCLELSLSVFKVFLAPLLNNYMIIKLLNIICSSPASFSPLPLSSCGWSPWDAPYNMMAY